MTTTPTDAFRDSIDLAGAAEWAQQVSEQLSVPKGIRHAAKGIATNLRRIHGNQHRARELDAAKGGGPYWDGFRWCEAHFPKSGDPDSPFVDIYGDHPPTQPGDAVERVARAMFDRHCGDKQRFPGDEAHIEHSWKMLRETYIADARAAIVAMPASGEG